MQTRQYSHASCRQAKGEKFGFCTMCACDLNVSHGDEFDIKIYITTKKHQGYM